MSYFPVEIETTEGQNKGQVKVCNTPEETPFGISFKVLQTNVQPKPLSKLEQYQRTYSYKSLLEKHGLSEYGTWQIKGEDPNCDWGGHHHQPHIETVEGKLEDVIKYGVELPQFWQWGAGGDFVKVQVTKKL